MEVPKEQPKRNSPCIRFRTRYKNHIRDYNLVVSKTYEGKAFRMFTLWTSTWGLSITVEGKITSHRVIEKPADALRKEYLSIYYGSGFTARAVRKWPERSSL